MDMLELIQIVNQVDDYIRYEISLEDLPPLQFYADTPEEKYYRKRGQRNEVKYFYDKESVIAFLFDKDLFGWEVRSYIIEEPWSQMTQFKIELYRFNCPQLDFTNN